MPGLSLGKRVSVGLWLVVLALGYATGCSRNQSKSDSMDKLFVVRKSDLVIGTLLRGTANAKQKHKLFPAAAYHCKLVWIEEENTYVEKGEVVIRFETQELLDDIEERKLAIESKEKSIGINREEKRILLSENLSSLRVASDSMATAEESYARYYKYDGKKAKDDLMGSVENADNALKKAVEDRRARLDEISNTIYDSDAAKKQALAQIEQLESAVEQRKQQYDAAKFNLKIFKKYTYPNTLTAKLNSLEHARLNQEKVEVRTASRVIQKDEQISRSEKELRRLQKELERIESYLPLMEVRAPVAGILVYGDADQKGEQRVNIDVGMDCYRNQVLATIPEMEHLIVDFELPELFRHRVAKGAAVVITPDALPSLKVAGKVSEIAVVPVHQLSWDQTSPKVYHSKITLDEQNENFVSGMNVQIEIIEDIVEQVPNIPVEAVFEEEGEYFVYLKTLGKIQKRIVELGKSNDQYVHITQGLEVGDSVYLYSPYKLDASE